MLFVLAVCLLPAFCVCHNPNPCVCGLPSDAGNTCAENNPSTRWFFNYITGMCERFHFNGCDSNANNFQTKRECMGTCRKDKRNRCYICPAIDVNNAVSCGTACNDDCDCSSGNKCCEVACSDAPSAYQCVPEVTEQCEPCGIFGYI